MNDEINQALKNVLDFFNEIDLSNVSMQTAYVAIGRISKLVSVTKSHFIDVCETDEERDMVEILANGKGKNKLYLLMSSENNFKISVNLLFKFLKEFVKQEAAKPDKNDRDNNLLRLNKKVLIENLNTSDDKFATLLASMRVTRKFKVNEELIRNHLLELIDIAFPPPKKAEDETDDSCDNYEYIIALIEFSTNEGVNKYGICGIDAGGLWVSETSEEEYALCMSDGLPIVEHVLTENSTDFDVLIVGSDQFVVTDNFEMVEYNSDLINTLLTQRSNMVRANFISVNE